MTDEGMKPPNNEEMPPYKEIPLYKIPGGSLARRDDQSDIRTYKDVLGEKFALAETVEEWEKLITLREKVQILDERDRRLEYAEKSANVQLKADGEDKSFQRIQQVVASISSVVIGGFFIQAFPLAGLLFLILGLARPLGYSLGEISDLLNGLKGFPKKTDDDLSDKREQNNQLEERIDARF